MATRRRILSTLSREALIEYVRGYDLKGLTNKPKAEIVDALVRLRRVPTEELLSYFTRGELKAACRECGLDDSGREKQVLIDRLLGKERDEEDEPEAVTEDTQTKNDQESQAERVKKEQPERSRGATGKGLDVGSLEDWLWNAACQIRGPLDAPKFKDYILPLIFLKRLSDVFEDEIRYLGHDFGDEQKAIKLAAQDRGLVRFYLPKRACWPVVAQKTTGLGEYLTDAVRSVARENPRLSGVIDVTDFNATTAGQRIVDDGRLASLVQILSKYRLGLEDVEPDILGRAYEYLLRKFAEGGGQSAGEFYTPREVGVLMARLLEPRPGQTVYDPCAGSGGLLIKCHLRLLETRGEKKNGRTKLPSSVKPLKLFGQEINGSTFAMARMNACIHDMEAEIALGETMHRPAFTEADGSLRQFDLVTANPMWNQKFNSKDL